MNNYRNCGCSMQQAAQQRCHCPGDDTLRALPENPVATMAYVPFQEDNGVYDVQQALMQGTLFPVLYKPFTAQRCGRG